jgi:hypothetical protein
MTTKLKKKKVKVRVTGTKKPKKKKKYYFGKEAHNAIVEYQNEKENCEKNKIYIEKIKPSFEKLTENLIFIHGFASCNTTFHILKSDCVSFLFETLQKFDSSKGSKAFSYFNVCAKHFLIIQQKKKIKRNSRHISLYDEGLTSEDKSQIENFSIEKCQEIQMIHKEDKVLIKEMLTLIENKTNNVNEKKCINAISTLFNKIEDLDYLNKRAVFVYLRELSGLNAKQLSVAMSNLRKYYRDITNNDLFMFFAE